VIRLKALIQSPIRPASPILIDGNRGPIIRGDMRAQNDRADKICPARPVRRQTRKSSDSSLQDGGGRHSHPDPLTTRERRCLGPNGAHRQSWPEVHPDQMREHGNQAAPDDSNAQASRSLSSRPGRSGKLPRCGIRSACVVVAKKGTEACRVCPACDLTPSPDVADCLEERCS